MILKKGDHLFVGRVLITRETNRSENNFEYEVVEQPNYDLEDTAIWVVKLKVVR